MRAFFKTISLCDDDDDRCFRACSGACSARLRTDYSPPGRRIKPRWKSAPSGKLWCCLWWPWLVSAQTRRRSRKRFGKCKSSCTPRWLTSRGPRRKAPRRDRRAEDDKCTEREKRERQRGEYLCMYQDPTRENFLTNKQRCCLFPLWVESVTTKSRRFGYRTTNKHTKQLWWKQKERKEEKT